MSDPFDVSDGYIPVPPQAVDADPAQEMRKLYYRLSRLEEALAEERSQTNLDMHQVLLQVIALSDQIGEFVQQYGVATNALQATMVRSVALIGQGLLAILKQQGVEAINTIGQLVDVETADVVGTEARPNVVQGKVLREAKVGYRWPHGLLRRAQVIVAGPLARSSDND